MLVTQAARAVTEPMERTSMRTNLEVLNPFDLIIATSMMHSDKESVSVEWSQIESSERGW